MSDSDVERLVAEFLAKGGEITKCPVKGYQGQWERKRHVSLSGPPTLKRNFMRKSYRVKAAAKRTTRGWK